MSILSMYILEIVKFSKNCLETVNFSTRNCQLTRNCLFFECACLATGRRRCIGCLNFQVSFCKKATNYMALLRKLTNKDKALYGSSSPCTYIQESLNIAKKDLHRKSPTYIQKSPTNNQTSHELTIYTWI